MRQIYTLLVGALFAIGTFSCYDDKGNYDYTWVLNIDLTDVLKDTTIRRGDVLNVQVDLKKFLNNSETETGSAAEEDYTYTWVVASGGTYDTLSTTKDLNDTIWLSISSQPYQINYSVTEKASGVTWSTFFKLTVVDRLTGGYIFMTEDAEQNVEIELYADDTEGNKVHETKVMARSGFPYTHGGANAIYYAALNNESPRLWVATGESTGWLDFPNFDWKETNMMHLLMAFPEDVSYTASTMANAGGGRAMFLYSATGELHVYVAVNTHLFYSDIAYINGEKFHAAPCIAGRTSTMNDALLVYDRDNKRFVSYPIGYLAMGVIQDYNCYEIDEASVLEGSELIYMQTLLPPNSSSAVAIIKDPEGKYQKCLFGTTMQSGKPLNRLSMLTVKEELQNNISILESAERWIIDQTHGYIYCSIGNKLYTYRAGGGIESFEEAVIEGVALDNIVSLNVLGDDAENIYVATYSAANKGMVYVLKPNETESRQLTVTEAISTEGAVKQITKW